MNENLEQQNRVLGAYEVSYRLSATLQLVAAAIISLKEKVTKVSDDFDVEYKRVMGLQEKESGLWDE